MSSLAAVAPGRKVAVILSGCGVFDGSEIHESCAALARLSKLGAHVTIFAPNAPQAHVINHTASAPQEGATRNILDEVNRIARGHAAALSTLNPAHFDALVLPGGFGVMKNLSTFAFGGDKAAIREDVAHAIVSFHAQKKPIAAACIAPVLLAAALAPHEVKPRITLGAAAGDAQDLARSFGAEVVEGGATQVVVDKANRLFTTPAFMLDSELYQVVEGVGNMIEAALSA
jgi:enhancing lycopene biosynthesis protein 2